MFSLREASKASESSLTKQVHVCGPFDMNFRHRGADDHPCEECDKRVFTAYDLQRRTDTRPFPSTESEQRFGATSERPAMQYAHPMDGRQTDISDRGYSPISASSADDHHPEDFTHRVVCVRCSVSQGRSFLSSVYLCNLRRSTRPATSLFGERFHDAGSLIQRPQTRDF